MMVIQAAISALVREVGRSEVQGHYQQQSEFKPGLGYMITINSWNVHCDFLGNACLSQVSLHTFFCHSRNKGYRLAELTQVDTRSNSPCIKGITGKKCACLWWFRIQESSVPQRSQWEKPTEKSGATHLPPGASWWPDHRTCLAGSNSRRCHCHRLWHCG